ncbi:ABC transporter ATP-binding protein [Stigmatella aurantiaca]|uniref:ABC-type oligopeptide transport system, ATPase component n=1 Tax=Stigmatella aurantiaca (strain DW4/3-1) TaxID=378806 RepID=Q08S19_STIAD|nr:ABC transporter ATP-binding protein [Stigmatella aurantiaca]ADO73144.1 ABC-type oligopeptide transport system, ATPase component [Stigmatella aurantiaca DW4/3-1]EAU63277.1 ABC-type oligopeptide transport system, ATPase component [Stigmatella aurantiaca DW4/3-1]
MTTASLENQVILEAKDLGKYFQVGGGFRPKRLRALNEVSFALGARQVVALVGESGSGKSTIARLLVRLMDPSSGKIFFRGRDILQEEPRRASLDYRSQVQMIFQDPFGSLNPVHTIGNHLERPLLLHGKAKSAAELKDRVHELLATVDLNPAAELAARYPHQLSGGQRQRVAIARALAPGPSVILADEPISMLDVSIRVGVLNLMERLKEQRGISYLYITHDIASARYFADRTMVMYAGHIVEGAPSEELMHKPAHPYTQLLLSAVPDPNGSMKSALKAKSGAPKLIDPPPGCPFADRCPSVMAVCRKAMPGATRIEQGRWVRCHLFGEGVASGMEVPQERSAAASRNAV